MVTSAASGQNVEADRAVALCDERPAGGSNPAAAGCFAPIESVLEEKAALIWMGIYDCMNCGKQYAVNRPDTWAPCSADLCHDCYPLPYTFNHQITYASITYTFLCS